MFEALFKYSYPTFARGELVLASPWPVFWLIALTSIAAIGIAIHLWRQHAGLARGRLLALWGLQTGLIALVLALLWQPVLSVSQLRHRANAIALLVDTSGSMRYGTDDRTRLQEALDAIEPKVLERLRADYELKVYGFASSPEPLEDLAALPPPGPVSYLGRSLHTVLREARTTPLGAVIVVSDGADNAAAADRPRPEDLARYGVPIHTVGVGPEVMPEDLELSDVVVSEQALPRSRVSAQFAIQRGAAAQTRIRVYDGDTVLASETLDLPAASGVSNHRIDFDIGEPGVRDLRFSLDPIPGERNTINNTQRRLVDVPDETRTVLYLEGEPRWEYKFLRRAMDGDRSVTLVTLLRTSPNKYYRQGVRSAEELQDGFPTTREELFGYDALIIGSFEAAALSEAQQQLIHDFVSERGGRLLLLGGRNGLAEGGWAISPVAKALPARLGDLVTPTFHRDQVPVRLTAAGAEAAITRLDPDPGRNGERWRDIPLIADYQDLGPIKPGAVTLLEALVDGNPRPLLVMQYYGRGASYIFATSGTWRWQMQLSHEDLTQETFWRQLVRDLVAGDAAPLQLSLDRPRYADERTVIITAQLRDNAYRPAGAAAVEVVASGDSGASVTATLRPVSDAPGVFRGSVELADAGIWRIDATAQIGDAPQIGASIHLLREDGVAEHFATARNRPLLERIADASGGSYRDIRDLDGLQDAIRYSGAGIVETELLDLWNMPAVFLLLLLLKALEWMLRLRWGRL